MLKFYHMLYRCHPETKRTHEADLAALEQRRLELEAMPDGPEKATCY